MSDLQHNTPVREPDKNEFFSLHSLEEDLPSQKSGYIDDSVQTRQAANYRRPIRKRRRRPYSGKSRIRSVGPSAFSFHALHNQFQTQPVIHFPPQIVNPFAYQPVPSLPNENPDTGEFNSHSIENRRNKPPSSFSSVSSGNPFTHFMISHDRPDKIQLSGIHIDRPKPTPHEINPFHEHTPVAEQSYPSHDTSQQIIDHNERINSEPHSFHQLPQKNPSEYLDHDRPDEAPQYIRPQEELHYSRPQEELHYSRPQKEPPYIRPQEETQYSRPEEPHHDIRQEEPYQNRPQNEHYYGRPPHQSPVYIRHEPPQVQQEQYHDNSKPLDHDSGHRVYRPNPFPTSTGYISTFNQGINTDVGFQMFHAPLPNANHYPSPKPPESVHQSTEYQTSQYEKPKDQLSYEEDSYDVTTPVTRFHEELDYPLHNYNENSHDERFIPGLETQQQFYPHTRDTLVDSPKNIINLRQSIKSSSDLKPSEEANINPIRQSIVQDDNRKKIPRFPEVDEVGTSPKPLIDFRQNYPKRERIPIRFNKNMNNKHISNDDQISKTTEAVLVELTTSRPRRPTRPKIRIPIRPHKSITTTESTFSIETTTFTEPFTMPPFKKAESSSIKANSPTRTRLSPSKAIHIPGTARHPELSKLRKKYSSNSSTHSSTSNKRTNKDGQQNNRYLRRNLPRLSN